MTRRCIGFHARFDWTASVAYNPSLRFAFLSDGGWHENHLRRQQRHHAGGAGSGRGDDAVSDGAILQSELDVRGCQAGRPCHRTGPQGYCRAVRAGGSAADPVYRLCDGKQQRGHLRLRERQSEPPTRHHHRRRTSSRAGGLQRARTRRLRGDVSRRRRRRKSRRGRVYPAGCGPTRCWSALCTPTTRPEWFFRSSSSRE